MEMGLPRALGVGCDGGMSTIERDSKEVMHNERRRARGGPCSLSCFRGIHDERHSGIEYPSQSQSPRCSTMVYPGGPCSFLGAGLEGNGSCCGIEGGGLDRTQICSPTQGARIYQHWMMPCDAHLDVSPRFRPPRAARLFHRCCCDASSIIVFINFTLFPTYYNNYTFSSSGPRQNPRSFREGGGPFCCLR